MIKNPPANARDIEMWVVGSSLVWEHSLEKGMATSPSFLAWSTPWTEEPGGLQYIGPQRVRQDRSDLAHMHIYMNKFLYVSVLYVLYKDM